MYNQVGKAPYLIPLILREKENVMSPSQNLNKVLSRVDVLVLAFGAMIGWGWVVLSGDWILKAGSIGAMFAFVAGGILVIFVGLTYAELTTALPKAGGAHHFVKEGLGRRAAFFVSWALLFGYISVSAFEAVALPTVIEYIFPHYQVGYMWTIAGWDVYASWAAVGVIGAVLVTFINWIGVKQAAVLQIVLTVILALVGLMLIFGAAVGGDVQHMNPLFIGGAAGLMGVMIMTPFMFVGFDVIPQVAEEMNIPMKMIGKILLVSVALAVIWYMLIILGVSLSLPPPFLLTANLATADAMGAVFGSPFFAKVLIFGGVAGILTSWNAFMIGSSRIIYAMAKDGMLPQWFGRIHPTYKTPGNAILTVGLLSALSPLLGRPALAWFVNAGGLAIVFAYLLVALSFIVLRKTRADLDRPFRAGKTRVIGWIALLLSIGFVVMYMPGMPASLIWPYEWMITLAWWIVGLMLFVKSIFSSLSPARLHKHSEKTH
ncbi:amino acid transporter [Bacillus chungangensis]|uniref:Amino acid transporter n=2 Tax=Bacillus chungangensis TaxID=587633 RepID=A0ABT9WPZ1_9BACI|nr:amino acid transporter [Bacillus chungangensis]